MLQHARSHGALSCRLTPSSLCGWCACQLSRACCVSLVLQACQAGGGGGLSSRQAGATWRRRKGNLRAGAGASSGDWALACRVTRGESVALQQATVGATFRGAAASLPQQPAGTCCPPLTLSVPQCSPGCAYRPTPFSCSSRRWEQGRGPVLCRCVQCSHPQCGHYLSPCAAHILR